jgi:hypothetical protein
MWASVEAGVRVERTWTLTRGERHLIEELRIEGTGVVEIAAAVAGLAGAGAGGGSAEGPSRIWTFGTSVPEAGALGLAAIVVDDHACVPVEIAGHRALRFRVEPPDTLRLVWMAGGEAYGDATEENLARAGGCHLVPRVSDIERLPRSLDALSRLF